MAEEHIDEVIQSTRKPRQSLLNRPSVTANDFAGVIGRPSLVASIEGSMREINGALDELTGTGRGAKNSGWRPSMRKQVSNKLGKNFYDDMDALGENQEYDYSDRNGDDFYSDDDGDQDLGDLQKELDDANSQYSRDEDKGTSPSVIAGDLDGLSLEEPPDNFIDNGDKPAYYDKSIGGEETAATSDSGSVPPEIQVNSSVPKDRLNEETDKENSENSQTKMEENVSDQEYEIGMQQVKLRALQEKMSASQMESDRMLLESSRELEAEKEAKSMLELQYLKLQQDYDKLNKEKEELYKINKLQQQAILDLQSQKR